MTPLRIRKNAAERPEAKRSRSACSSSRPSRPGRDGADDEQPAEPRVAVVADLAVAQRAPEARAGCAPSRARRTPSSTSAVARCVATRNVTKNGVVLVDVPAEQARQDHAVAEARDGEELAEALQQAEQDRLPVGDQRERSCEHAVRPPVRVRGPVWNQASTNAPRPSSERGDAVLDVVVRRAGLVAGEEARQRLRRLGEVDDRDHDQARRRRCRRR